MSTILLSQIGQQVFRVNADKNKKEKDLYIPYWALSIDELLKVTPFGNISDEDRVPVSDRIRQLKISSLHTTQRAGVSEDTLTADTPISFSIHRLWYELHREILSTHTAQRANQSEETEAIKKDSGGQPLIGDIMEVRPPEYLPITQRGQNRIYLSGSTLNIRRQVMALGSLLRDTRYDFSFSTWTWCPIPNHGDLDAQPEKDLDELLKMWIGGDRPITILDLSGVPDRVLMDLVGVLLRLLYDSLFWSRNMPEGGRRPSVTYRP